MTVIPIKNENDKDYSVVFPPAPSINVPVGYMQTGNGSGVDLLNPRVEDVDWNLIARSLALQCRYTGHMKTLDDFLSIAQHSCIVADLMPEPIRLYGLLHDAHEAFWGDDATPKKRALAKDHPEAAAWLEGCKAMWDAVIWQAAKLPQPTPNILRAVKEADYQALAIEHQCLQAAPVDDVTRAAWAGLPNVRHFAVAAVPPQAAHDMFLVRLNELLWANSVHAEGYA